MRLLLAFILAVTILSVSGCDDGCPEGQHRHVMTVNKITTSFCVND
jgi:hypothetical protein